MNHTHSLHTLSRAAVLAGLWLAVAPGAALAQGTSVTDVQNLEPQLPTEVEDAEPIRSGAREVQLPIRLTREQDGDDRFVIEPRFAWGIAPRFQAVVGLPLVVGSSDRTNSGNLRGDLLYKAIDEGGLLPAIAVAGGIELPTGKDAEGTDLTLRLLATKSLGALPGTHRLHANVVWRLNDDARPGERDNTYRFIVGYSTPLSASTVIVADAIRGHGRLGATGMSTVFEVGVRHALSRGTTVALGVGIGDGADAPDWSITAGLQTQF